MFVAFCSRCSHASCCPLGVFVVVRPRCARALWFVQGVFGVPCCRCVRAYLANRAWAPGGVLKMFICNIRLLLERKRTQNRFWGGEGAMGGNRTQRKVKYRKDILYFLELFVAVRLKLTVERTG